MAEMEISSSMAETVAQNNFPVKRKRNLPGNPGKVALQFYQLLFTFDFCYTWAEPLSKKEKNSLYF